MTAKLSGQFVDGGPQPIGDYELGDLLIVESLLALAGAARAPILIVNGRNRRLESESGLGDLLHQGSTFLRVQLR